jgi:hypothetical protein
LKSRIRNCGASIEPGKHKPVEFKVFLADLGNNVDLCCPDDERPHIDFLHSDCPSDPLNAQHGRAPASPAGARGQSYGVARDSHPVQI